MTTVNLKLQFPTKYDQFASLNGCSFDGVSIGLTWGEFFSLIAGLDAKTRNSFKECDFVIRKSARGRGRQHHFSEKIEEFINTFRIIRTERTVYTVYLRRISSQDDCYPQGFREPEVPIMPKIDPRSFDTRTRTYSTISSPRVKSYESGSKRASKQHHDIDEKPVKSSKLCDAPLGTPTSADNLEMDVSESSGSSRSAFQKGLEENEEVQSDTVTVSLNAEDFKDLEGNYGTKYQAEKGMQKELGKVQDETSVAGGILGENARGKYVQGVDAGGNGGNIQDAEIKNISFVEDVKNDKSETQVQNSYELGTSVEEINDDGNGNSMDGKILIRIEGADGQLNENSDEADKETVNQPKQRGIEQIILENSIVIKQEDENDDVEIIEVAISKSAGRLSVKTEVEVPNSDGQEDMCESKADVSTVKAENIPNEEKFEGEMERKAKFLQELKNLSNDDFQMFQKELKQLNSMQGKSRTILRGKAKHILTFLVEFDMSSQSLQEFTDEVQNKLKDSRVQEISEEIKRLRDERELRNIFSPDLTLFLMDCFC